MKHTKVYQWFLVVEGRGSFPFDMLRYDACFPFEQVDSSKLFEAGKKRRVVLVRRGLNDSKCSGERWASFGWPVLHATDDSGEARRIAEYCEACAAHYDDAGKCDEGKPVDSPHRAAPKAAP